MCSDKVRHGPVRYAEGVRFNTIDSTVALTVAFFVNAAILVLAAMVFYGKQSVTVAGGQMVMFNPDSDWIRIAYLTLAPLLGTMAASTLFAVALLASGWFLMILGWGSAILITIMDIYSLPESLKAAWHIIAGG